MEALSRALGSHASQDASLNAYLIFGLCELCAVEAAPLIELAFDQGHVDLLVGGDWEEAQVRLGLLEKRLTPPTYGLLGDRLFSPNPDLAGAAPLPSRAQRKQRAPTTKKQRSQRKAKRKNQKKARRKQRKRK